MVPADLVVDPQLSAAVLAWTAVGVVIGSLSGAIPGLHANNFAFLLAGVAPAVPGPPLLVGVAMLAAGVVHTFVNAVPAMALGVPDAEMALTALPGHRLVLAGRGHEAIHLSAVGSLLAVVFAAPLSIPLTWIVVRIYPIVIEHLALVLGAVVLGLVGAERRPRRGIAAGLSFGLAAVLGIVTLDVQPSAPLDAGGVLAPLFAGLFGAPVLIDALGGGGIPPQEEPRLRVSRSVLAVTALAGTIAGAIVGYLPGISAAIAAIAVLVVLPGDGSVGTADDRGYIVATSGVDTANTVFALVALVALGQPRTGVMVAVAETEVPLDVPVLLAAILLAGVCGFVIVIVGGEYYLTLVARVEYATLSLSVLGVLLALSWLFTGVVGIAIFLVASLVGLVPVRLGVRRVHLMGVLLGPLILASV